MKLVKKLLICLLIVTAVIGITTVSVSAYYKKNPEIKYVQKEAKEKVVYTYQEITGEEIEAGIRNIKEMHTASYNFTRVQRFYNVKRADLSVIGIDLNFDIPGTKKSFSFSYEGQVTAGIEFDKVKVIKDEENKVIYVELPEPVLFDPIIDTASYEFYEVDNSLFNPIEPEDYAVALDELVNAERANAQNSTVLIDARDNAMNLISGFVKGIASSYRIEFVDGSASV